MKKQIFLPIILATTLAIAGFTIGRYSVPTPPEVEIIEIAAPTVTTGTSVSNAKIDLLVKQLADAETKISELNAQIDHLIGEDLPAVAATEEPEPRQPREGWQARMERMKTDEPERYAEMMAQREERERARKEFMDERKRNEDDRDQFFANVNIAYMPEEEQQALATFVAEYQELRKLIESRMQGEQPNMEQATQLGMNVLTKTPEIRVSLLKATAKEMGFNNEESGEFATTVNDIFGATSLMGPDSGASVFRGMRAMGRGGRR